MTNSYVGPYYRNALINIKNQSAKLDANTIVGADSILMQFENKTQWIAPIQQAMKKTVSLLDSGKNYICTGFLMQRKNINYVVSAKHCVASSNSSSYIARIYKTDGSRTFQNINTSLVGVDPNLDVAVFKYKTTTNYTQTTFNQLPYHSFYTQTTPLAIGQKMFIIGSGLGHEVGVLEGIIANINDLVTTNVTNSRQLVTYTNTIYTTCQSQPGNSGSAAIALEYDINGNLVANVIGILTWGNMQNDNDAHVGIPGFGFVHSQATVATAVQGILTRARLW